MKKDDFLGQNCSDANHVLELGKPMDEYEVKYLTVRNAAWGFMSVIQHQQAKQIADVLLPFAYALKEYWGFHVKDTFNIPDLRTEDGVRSFFDDEVCKQIAVCIRNGVE